MRLLRTSRSHPLRVDSFAVGAAGGRVGMASCPGKQGRDVWGGHWSRDLTADLAALRDWGADVVVTLVEDRELELLKVPQLGESVREAGMEWRHAPIPDMHPPDEHFEALWPTLAAELKEILEQGGRVVVHCRAGLGRTGLVAALLAIELGDTPPQAIRRVRATRRRVIETPGQKHYVTDYRPVTRVPRPSRTTPSLGRRLFRLENKAMVLWWRTSHRQLGMANPWVGFIMVLVHTGRRSGLRRYTPLNFAEIDGDIWCVAGYGTSTDWYRNLRTNPGVGVWLPDGRHLSAEATDASDLPDAERLPLVRAVLVNSGFAAYLAGLNPRRLSDAELAAATASYRLVRLHPTGPADDAGPPAPGDLAWVRWAGIAVVVLTVGVAMLRRHVTPPIPGE
ncbi:MAG: nitroreductase family deazaflavin-dependent oxidoreductase [Actinomycetota bacterium]